MSSEWTVTDYGTVHIHGHRTGDNGRTIGVQHTFSIVPTTVNGIADLLSEDALQHDLPKTVMNAAGQWVNPPPGADPTLPISDWGLPTGLYFVRGASGRVHKVLLP